MPLLCMLKADAIGRTCEDKAELLGIELFELFCREAGLLGQTNHSTSPAGRFIIFIIKRHHGLPTF